MAISRTTLNRIDAWYAANLEARLQSAQASALGANGEYTQGLLSHGAVPAPNATVVTRDAVPDAIATQPHDRPRALTTLLRPADRSTSWPCAIQVDVYVGNLGHGWMVTLVVDDLSERGAIYERTIDYGPGGRDKAWERRAD